MNKKLLYIINMLLAVFFLSSCKNGDWSFPDYDNPNSDKNTAVYFAYQSPIRTITLGEDLSTDNSMDNRHEFQIMATMGGVYENTKDVTIDISIDNNLCNGVTYESGEDIVPMPSHYYTVSGNQIVIKNGKILGGVTIHLEDAFFDDPLATQLNYVIPVKMTQVANADSILSGKPQDGIDNPVLQYASNWSIQPKNFVLYAVKYINQYQSNYLRRGVDSYSGARIGITRRHAEFVEKDEVVQDQFTTLGINVAQWARPTKDADGDIIECNLRLNFDAEGKCTISTTSAGVTATGTGQFVPQGDYWGDRARDVLYLDYTLEYDGITCATKDTLVVRDRGVKAEWFKIQEK